jgi:hypothetical protein
MMLTWLADVLRAGGLNVTEIPGWQSRGHCQMKGCFGVLGHHTAGPASGNYPSLAVVRDGRSNLAGPLCNLGLARDGSWLVVAAGVAWHAGTGVLPWCPRDEGNDYLIGIEAESTGLGDWTPAQLTSYPKGVAVLLAHLGLPADRFAGHLEYAPTRKIDPALWPGAMNGFRASVTTNLTPKPAAPKHIEEDAMFLAMGPTPDARLGLLSGGIFRELSAGERATAQDTIKRQGAPELYVDQATWDFYVAASKTLLGA